MNILPFLLIFRTFAYEYSLVLLQKQEASQLVCFFLHGHRGHYLQVTPLLQVLTSCDVYSFDFLEDISGLSDRVILKQAQFIEETLQEFASHQKRVVLICHSMGGISGILGAASSHSLVSKVITLNTPLGQSPVNSHFMFPYIYSRIHSILQDDVLGVVSITGADDSTVPPILTQAAELKSRHFYTTTLIRETLEHNEILNSNKMRFKVSQIVENRPVLQEEFLFEEMDFKENDDCWVHDPKMVGLGSVEAETKKWIGFKSEEDQEVLVKVQGKLLKTCRGDRRLINRNLFIKNIEYLKVHVLKSEKLFFLLESGRLEILQMKIFKCLRIYYKYCIFESKQPALIKVGHLLRTPLMVETSELSEWIYSRCGKEEVLLEKTEEALIKFHEKCTKGVEVLIFSQNFKFRVSTPVAEALAEFFKDFRLEILTFSFAFLFERSLRVVPAVLAYWWLGKYFRFFGLVLLDHVDFYDKHVTIPEVFLLALTAFMISSAFQWLLSHLSLIQIQKTHKRSKKLLLIMIVLLAALPWVIIPVFLLRPARIYSEFDQKLIFVQFLLTIPQQISFFYIPVYYFSFSIGTISDFLSVFPMLTTSLVPSLNHKTTPLVMCYIYILLVQDLLYRGQISVLILSTYQLIQYLLMKNTKN